MIPASCQNGMASEIPLHNPALFTNRGHRSRKKLLTSAMFTSSLCERKGWDLELFEAVCRFS